MCGWTLWRGIIMTAAAVWLAVATLTSADPAGWDLFALAYMALFGLATGVAWIAYSLAWPGVFRRRWHSVLWAAVPLAPVVAVVSRSAEWPLTVRVWFSEKPLREFVETDGQGPTRVGTFHVARQHRQGQVVLMTTGYKMFTACGVMYAPAGPPPESNEWPLFVAHLYGPWYRFVIRD